MKFQCRECQGIVVVDFEGDMVNCGICDAVCKVPAPFSEGVVIDDFLILKLLGAGGMGNVYLAHEFSLDRKVALKILKDSISKNTEVRNSFIKEARSVASLNHPNIIQAYKVGLEENGTLFFAMEYVEGQTLQDLQKQNGMLEEKLVLDIAFDTVTAIGYAWEKRQLVHRDIKPENIMISNDDGRTKLMDLGLSCHAGEADADGDQISGTPQYISPEQIMGTNIDIRTDFYCLGATLYHLLSGEFPFKGNLQEIVKQHLAEPPRSLKKHRPDLNDNTVKVIHRLMKKNPKDRYSSPEKLLRDITKAKTLITNTQKSKKHISIKPTEVITHVKTEKRKNRKEDSQKKKVLAVLGLVLLVTFGGILLMATKKFNPNPDAKPKEELVSKKQQKNEKIDIVTQPVQSLPASTTQLSEEDGEENSALEKQYNGLLHRYSFNKVSKSLEAEDSLLTPDSKQGADFLIYGDIGVDKGLLKYHSHDNGRVKLSGKFKDLSDSSLKGQSKFAFEAWIQCDQLSIDSNKELRYLIKSKKIPFKENVYFYYSIAIDLADTHFRIYFGPVGGKLEYKSFPLTAELKKKFNLVESDSLLLRSLLGFNRFKGAINEFRIWSGNVRFGVVRKMAKLPPGRAITENMPKEIIQNTEKESGLRYLSYDVEDLTFLEKYKELKTKSSGEVSILRVGIEPENNMIGLVFEGYIKVPDKGGYKLSVDSEDDYEIFINEERVLYNSGNQKNTINNVDLHEGYNTLKVVYCNLERSRKFKLQYEKEDGKISNIPGRWYFRDEVPEDNNLKVILKDGDLWYHYTKPEAPPKDWYSYKGDDEFWVKKATGIGYGNKDLKTIIPKGTLVHYFKRNFTLDKVQDLKLRVLYDDGCVVYLNGKEFKRFNMPEGEVSESTPARERIKSSKSELVIIPASKLKQRNNSIAISVHNKGVSSSDLVFTAELEKE